MACASWSPVSRRSRRRSRPSHILFCVSNLTPFHMRMSKKLSLMHITGTRKKLEEALSWNRMERVNRSKYFIYKKKLDD
jgi:hypothetical protein